MMHKECNQKTKQIVNIAIFALCLMLGGLTNLLSPDRKISEQENRTLAQLPQYSREKLFSGELFTEYENYYADQFFSRDYFVGIRNGIKSRMGFPGAQEIQLVTTGGFNAFEEHIASDDSGKTMYPDITGLDAPKSVSPADTLQNDGNGVQPASASDGTPAALSAGNSEMPSAAAPSGETAPAVSPAAQPSETATALAPSPTATNGTTASMTHPANTSGETAGSPSLAASSATASVVPSGQASISPNLAENTEPADAPAGSQAPSPTENPARDDNGKTIGKVLIYKDSAYALFPFSQDSANYYVKTLHEFRQEAGDEVTVYSMLVPTNMEFLQEEKFQALTDSQKDAIDYVYAKLQGVVPVDAYTPLKEHCDEYVYFRTDHHWTALGAYYAYTGFAKAAGFEPVSLDRYQTETIEDYVGSMYETTGSSNLKRNPDTITVYKPFTKNEYNVYYSSAIKMKVIDMSHADKKVKYRVFLSGDRPLGIIKTEVANGRKILVIKDSYGNAMVPFLLPHYEEIYVVDPRQYEKNIFQLIQNNDIQEVLFLNYVPILSYYGYIDLVVKIMK